MQPLVSVVIPSYNKSNYIAETLDSLIVQDFKNWEAIIVDDGSTDNSINIIKKYVINDSRIILLTRNREPKGASVCRNIGIEKSHSDYIIFLDADDLLTTNALEQRVNFTDNNPDEDFLVFPMGHFIDKLGDSNVIKCSSDSVDHLLKFLSYICQWTVSSPIWKKSFLCHIGMFDEEYPRLQDVELHTRALLEEGVKYKVISDVEPDFYYRIDPLRASDSDNVVKAKNALDGFEMFLNKISIIIKEKPQSLLYFKALKTVFYKVSKNIANHKISLKYKYKLLQRITKNKIYNDQMLIRDKILFYSVFFKNILIFYIKYIISFRTFSSEKNII